MSMYSISKTSRHPCVHETIEQSCIEDPTQRIYSPNSTPKFQKRDHAPSWLIRGTSAFRRTLVLNQLSCIRRYNTPVYG
ncbi:unnamed protein product [Periconia digitata]|uniref:Uncharacterized protein n=1 Tax=Periconia digitata TaxID=1303443 RepID=A0A9W4U585_9PLEO|nr:unnamed protein product [Periconia digitata]